MLVASWAVGEARDWAHALDLRLTVVLLKRAKRCAASRLALRALLADEAVAELVGVGAARKNVLVFRLICRVEHFLQLLHSVLDRINVSNSRLDRGQARRHWRRVGRLQDASAEAVVGQGQTTLQGEGNEVATAAIVAVAVLDARLTIALVVSTVDLAAVLASIGWRVNLVRTQKVVLAAAVFVLVLAVVDFGSDGPRAELVFNECVTRFGAVTMHLATA